MDLVEGAAMTQELKPCPFCGGEAHVLAQHWDDGSHVWWVECAACGAEGMRCDDGQHAIDAWNTRAERTCTFEPESSGLLGQYKCSSCNDTVRLASLKMLERLHYCPNCGTKVVNK